MSHRPVDPSVDCRPIDTHLATVAEIIDTIHFHNECTPQYMAAPLRLFDVCVDALDAWACELAVEHHQSRPFTATGTSAERDRDVTVWCEFIAALGYLRERGDTTTSFESAWNEALDLWLLAHRPELDADQPADAGS